MGTQQPKIDLSRLPLHFRKVNSKWWKNTKSGAWISHNNIHLFLPKEEIQIEPKPSKEYWWNNY